jgi:hypothetical protein
MRSTISLLAVIVFCVAGVSGQKAKACDLTIADSPTLRGLHLGQSLSELNERFPRLRTAFKDARSRMAKDVALGRISVSSHALFQAGDPIPEEFQDVVFTLIFIDESLLGFYVEYATYEPDDVAEFIKHVSQTTKLPAKGWAMTNSEDASIKCRDFEAKLWTGRLAGEKKITVFPNFALYDLQRVRHLDERQTIQRADAKIAADSEAKAEKNSKKSFRP